MKGLRRADWPHLAHRVVDGRRQWRPHTISGSVGERGASDSSGEQAQIQARQDGGASQSTQEANRHRKVRT
jgi:hypothetical protein